MVLVETARIRDKSPPICMSHSLEVRQWSTTRSMTYSWFRDPAGFPDSSFGHAICPHVFALVSHFKYSFLTCEDWYVTGIARWLRGEPTNSFYGRHSGMVPCNLDSKICSILLMPKNSQRQCATFPGISNQRSEALLTLEGLLGLWDCSFRHIKRAKATRNEGFVRQAERKDRRHELEAGILVERRPRHVRGASPGHEDYLKQR